MHAHEPLKEVSICHFRQDKASVSWNSEVIHSKEVGINKKIIPQFGFVIQSNPLLGGSVMGGSTVPTLRCLEGSSRPTAGFLSVCVGN